MKKNMR